MSAAADLEPLRRFCAELGRDPTLIQGAGGNVSVKRDGVLWVKASGTWLAAALAEEIFVPVDRARVLAAIAAGAGDPVKDTVPAGFALRPSIETTLHALLPHAVVLHLHSVAALALAIRADGRARIAERLAGLRWVWVPYRRPGLPLTLAVRDALAAAPADILVLGNHGLVVGGADIEAADALLREVERRLAGQVRPAPAGDGEALAALATATAYRLPVLAESHGLGTDPVSCRMAAAGTYYPDHVIFLGPGGVRVRETVPHGDPPPVLVVPGRGALVRRDLTAGAEEMVRCLALVLARVPADAALVALDPDEEAGLCGWDAEKYRQALDQDRNRDG